MNDDHELAELARAIVDANVYVTLATADGDGMPHASPVFFAARDPRTLFWMSTLDAQHSRNLLVRPAISMVMFDSHIAVGHGQAVYLQGTARTVPEEQLDDALRWYPGPPSRGARRTAPEDLRGEAPWRLYRADVTEHFVLCPRQDGVCVRHREPNDHRISVLL
jgi:nitroimidazol reductase NimA-like FMN-containing flavoprotein (pyridoxamine 5'-phosphate oxidase superfamily)